MKKLILLFIGCCVLTFTAQTQTKVVLTFTGQMQDGSFVALDSVQVFNSTQSWSETLFYPDTVLEMEEEIDKPPFIASLQSKGLELSSALPNPFNGTADVLLQLPQSESVTLSLYDINGKEYLSRTLILEAGTHNLKLTTAIAQMYFLQVKTSLGSKTIKLLNLTKGADFDIAHTLVQSDKSPLGDLGVGNLKLSTQKTFKANDAMLFIGYRTKGSEIDTVQIRVQQAASNAAYTFGFQIGYTIGDVYYNNGIAEGMVWWLADTLVIVDGVAYGEHGKLIALREPPIPQYQTGSMWGICNPKIPVPAYDTLDGISNTAIIKSVRDTLTVDQPWRFQAMSWCVDSLGGDWYLPAIGELRQLFTVVVPILNPALEKIQGAVKFTDLMGAAYWSSTADKNDNLRAYMMSWSLYPHHSNIPDYGYVSRQQTTYGLVRAVKLF